MSADVEDEESPCYSLGHLDEYIADEDEKWIVYGCRACGAEWEEDHDDMEDDWEPEDLTDRLSDLANRLFHYGNVNFDQGDVDLVHEAIAELRKP